MEDDVIVREVLAALVVIAAEMLVGSLSRSLICSIICSIILAEKDVKRSGHAQMHDKDVARR